jgi:hypothetical protein
MILSSKAITLVLVGTSAALLGYSAMSPHHPDGGGDFDQSDEWIDGPGSGPTTAPSSGYSGPHYHYYHHSSGFFGWPGSNYFRSSSSRSGSSSSFHSSTSRGGFGHTGHASGS